MIQPDLQRLEELEQEARASANPVVAARQHKLGRLLAHERVSELVDRGSFCELGGLMHSAGHGQRSKLGDGVITGTGRILGRPVAVYAHDAAVMRGSVGALGAMKIVRLLDLAKQQGVPVIALQDSEGARVGDGAESIIGMGSLLERTAQLTGWVPQLSVVNGLCVGGPAYAAALHDLVIARPDHAHMFVTGPHVCKIALGTDTSLEELGGITMHARQTGLVHLVANEELDAFELVRRLLSYLPLNAAEPPPFAECVDSTDRLTPEILSFIPESPKRAYDVKPIVGAIVDRESFLELQADYGQSLVVGVARMGGRPVGIVASQPLVRAGALDIDSSRKGARFVQLCDAFGLAIITLADVPGFQPGKDQEQNGLLLHGAKLISAYSTGTTPRISLILRKSYGGGNVLAFPGHVRLGFPFARVQSMGKEAGIAVASHSSFGPSNGALSQSAQDHADEADSVLAAPAAGLIDRLIHPTETRMQLCSVLRAFPGRLAPTTRGARLNVPM